MHKLILKMFEFTRSCIKFLKVVIVFCILMLLFYWTQNLLGSHWGWLDFISPLLEFLVDIGEKISNGYIMLFHAVFEYKYAIAGFIFIIMYLLAHLMYKTTNLLEEFYCDSRRFVKKTNENRFNTSLQIKNTTEQLMITKFYVYATATIKPKFNNKNFNINLEEQKKEMARFITEKTGVFPQSHEGGFLYKYTSFDKIDKVIECLLKVVHAQTPLDYVIGIQIITGNSIKDMEQINTLKALDIKNKITSFADTNYRYTFNKGRKYKTTQVGVFQKNGKTFEVHEFY